MKKWIYGGAFILVILLASLATWFYLKPQKNVDKPSLPDELSTNFDFTQNAAKFMVENVDAQSNIMQLKVVWPKVVEGQIVNSVIKCIEGDIKISSKSDDNKRVISRAELLDTIYKTSKPFMILTGYCNDASCTEINKSCELYVGQ